MSKLSNLSNPGSVKNTNCLNYKTKDIIAFSDYLHSNVLKMVQKSSNTSKQSKFVKLVFIMDLQSMSYISTKQIWANQVEAGKLQPNKTVALMM